MRKTGDIGVIVGLHLGPDLMALMPKMIHDPAIGMEIRTFFERVAITVKVFGRHLRIDVLGAIRDFSQRRV